MVIFRLHIAFDWFALHQKLSLIEILIDIYFMSIGHVISGYQCAIVHRYKVGAMHEIYHVYGSCAAARLESGWPAWPGRPGLCFIKHK